MKFIPHRYQEYAIQRVIDSEAVALFLDPGLGKTAITLSAVNELMYDRFEVARVLVVAPLRVAEDTWGREAEKWDHTRRLKISKVLGSEKERTRALEAEADVYVTNRENLAWLVERRGRDWPFDMVVIDELSGFKNASSKRFKALRKVRPLVRRIVGLTGTPTPNGLIDLWPQIYLLDRGERLGPTLTGYRETFFRPGKRGPNGMVYSWEPKPGAEQEIYRRISDICVSMRAEDWLELPERIDRVVPVRLPAEAMGAYRRLEREYVLAFPDADVVAGSAAALANKLLQVANGAVYDESGGVREIHTAKLDALEDLAEAAGGQPVMVFYAFRHDLDRLLRRFPGARPLRTAADIEDWNAGKIPMLLVHPASAGHGLNLQHGGHIAVWFGLPWSLELYQQANARLHRQGQTERVIVHHLVAEGTMDEEVMRALGRKSAGQEALLEAVRARISGVINNFQIKSA